MLLISLINKLNQSKLLLILASQFNNVIKQYCLYILILLQSFFNLPSNASVLQNMTQKAVCPFNPSHTFAAEKFIFHINRCKDRQKLMHQFRRCEYNPMHFVPIDQFQTHNIICPDQEMIKKLTKQIKRNYERTRQRRQRSREKVKREQKLQNQKKQEIAQYQEQCLSDCEQCKDLLKVYEKEISTNRQLLKYIMKYQQLGL